MKKFFALIALLAALACPDADAAPRGGGSLIPKPALNAGYTLNTFSCIKCFTTGTVDMSATLSHGFKWYLWNFFSHSPSSSGITLGSDGTAALYQGFNSSLVSAGLIASPPYYVGTAFGGGGYFEAEVYFNPYTSVSGTDWPAWWMMSLEHLASDFGSQWPGQATSYNHFMEVDTFEYDRSSITQYGATLHDWYGIYNSTCGSTGGYCNVPSAFNVATVNVLKGTDWTIPHRIAVLWIPATASVNGSYTFYFDDIPMTQTTYSQFTTQSPPPTTSTSWTFGIGDQQHEVLILGDLNVKSVNVWQATTANNLTN